MSHKNHFQVCNFRNSKCVKYHLTFPYSENAQTALGEHLNNFDKVHQKFRNVMKIQSLHTISQAIFYRHFYQEFNSQ